MKGKIVPTKVIFGCVDCPGMHRGFCSYVDPERDLSYSVSIERIAKHKSAFPEWCPLEDAGE